MPRLPANDVDCSKTPAGQSLASAPCSVPISGIQFQHFWDMPNAETFSVPVIGAFVREYLNDSKVSIDPFSRNKRWATHTNDINPNTKAEHHMEARAFLDKMIKEGVKADLILFDPPYSPGQAKECYEEAGMKLPLENAQNAKLNADCRKRFRQLAAPGCRVLTFGWNTVGMGEGWEMERVILVCHGGAHNDTICMAEKLSSYQETLF